MFRLPLLSPGARDTCLLLHVAMLCAGFDPLRTNSLTQRLVTRFSNGFTRKRSSASSAVIQPTPITGVTT